MPTTTVEVITLNVSDPQLIQKARRAIDQRKTVELVISGEKAVAGNAAFSRLGLGPGVSTAVDPFSLAALLAAFGLAVIGTICVVGMSLGYKVSIDHDANGPSPFDDKLKIRLVPPRQ